MKLVLLTFGLMKGGITMSSGNVVEWYSTFSRRVVANLWPALGEAAKDGRIDLAQLACDQDEIIRSLRRGFLEETSGFSTWTRIYLGMHLNCNTLIKELDEKGVHVLLPARRVASMITVSSKREIDLVKVSMRQLGFSELVKLTEVADSARTLGFELVPEDAALYAALQVGERVECGEIVIFPMAAVSDSGSYDFVVFVLGRSPYDGGLDLNAYFGYSDVQLSPGLQVVFSRA
ncbi:MAG: hypothetical protein ACQESA_02590 [Patescibacteria group bacterium]